MKKFGIILLAITFSLAVNAQEKRLVSYEKIESHSIDDLKAKWKENHVPRMMMKIKHPVDVYEVVYHTEYHDGSKVRASGLFFVPSDMKEDIPTVIYNHGTSSRKARGEGVDGYFNGEGLIGMLFAADGYAVAMQDYIGLGKGDKFHLYHHAETEARGGIHMYLTCRDEISRELGVALDDRIFVTGYSQGGHATMALHKHAQEQYADQLKITATSPMSGAYDLHNIMVSVMYDEYAQPHYLPYLIMGYNEVYRIFPPEELFNIFVPPYDASIPGMFDGKTSVGTINKALPTVPVEMFKEEMVYQFENNPDFEFKARLKENSLYDWKPESPVQLCYCRDDEEVLYKNSELAYEVMKAREAEHVYKRRVGKKMTHRQCADFAILQTKFFFNSIRKGKERGRKGPFFKRGLVTLAKAFR